MRALLTAALALAALPALAQERPSDEAIFGAPGPAPEAEAPAPAAGAERQSEDAMFGEPARGAPAAGARPAAPGPAEAGDARELAPEDPLRIGGQLYWRAFSLASEGQPPAQWAFSTPTLLDVYLDARPNARVRGFALGRLSYDPTVNESAPASFALPGATAKQLSVALDQLWLNFDLERAVFVTAGRQHVKWGPARFWNPTDFLHQVHRDPLAQFDARVGTTLVKLHVPWERRGWNFYAVGLLEDAVPGATLGKVGGGARGEVVFGQAEIGVDALVQRGHRPKLGADVSAGIGPFDVYAEASLRKGADAPTWHLVPGASESFALEDVSGYSTQATFGASWAFNFTDALVLTLGGEYFYNALGTSEPRLYPWLILQGQFTPFYLGRHYLGLFAVWTNPSRRTAPTVTLSNLSNLSDLSHLARVDCSLVLLTHLRVEAYAAWHYGHQGGEFRFGIDLPALAIFVPYALLEGGIGLRISL